MYADDDDVDKYDDVGRMMRAVMIVTTRTMTMAD